MAGKNTCNLDEKGRVLIPQSMRDVLNLKPGEKMVLELDTKGKAIVISPAHEKKLLKLDILLSDSPGALAHAAVALARLGIDFVSTQSHSSVRGEEAVWEVACNPGKISAQEIRVALAKSGAKLISAEWE